MTVVTKGKQAGDVTGTIRSKIGIVTSDKCDKTRAVEVEFQTRHPKYGKYLRRRSRLYVHDPNNRSKLGDHVEVVHCRPISKSKSWRLVRVVKAAI